MATREKDRNQENQKSRKDKKYRYLYRTAMVGLKKNVNTSRNRPSLEPRTFIPLWFVRPASVVACKSGPGRGSQGTPSTAGSDRGKVLYSFRRNQVGSVLGWNVLAWISDLIASMFAR